MPNIHLLPLERPSSFRRLAPAVWDDMFQASILGAMDVRAEPIEAFCASERERTGTKVTLTHCVARAVAVALAAHPDANAVVIRRRVWRRRDVDVFLQVALPSENPQRLGQTDLGGVLIRQADRLEVAALANEVAGRAAKLRAGADDEFKRQRSLASVLPGWLLARLLWVVAFLQYELNLDTRWLGVARDPFGSASVTSVGMFDVPLGFAPFFPLARNVLIVCVGAVRVAPVVDGDRVVAGRVFSVTATIDHRVLDGATAAILTREIRDLLADPTRLNAAPVSQP